MNPYWHRYLFTHPALVTKVIREEHVSSRGVRLHPDVHQRGDDVSFAPPYLDRPLPPLADWFEETLG